MPSMRRLMPVLVLAPLALALLACAPEEQEETVTEVDSCATEDLAVLTPGTLTIATDSPAFPPWFENNKPANGKGFESAVAYAVAEQLGFDKAHVKWVKVPFNKSYAPRRGGVRLRHQSDLDHTRTAEGGRLLRRLLHRRPGRHHPEGRRRQRGLRWPT